MMGHDEDEDDSYDRNDEKEAGEEKQDRKLPLNSE
jgi:hypothetical protein